MIRKSRRKLMLLITAILLLVSAGIAASINLINWHYVETQAESVLDNIAENEVFIPEMEHNLAQDSCSQEIAPADSSTLVLNEVSLTNLTVAVSTSSDAAFGEVPLEIKDGEAKVEDEPDKNASDGPASQIQDGDAPDRLWENMEDSDNGSPLTDPYMLSPEAIPSGTPTGEETDNKGAGYQKPKKPDSLGQPAETEESKTSLRNYYVVFFNVDGTIEGWGSDKDELYSDGQVMDMTAVALANGKENGHEGSQFYQFVELHGQRLLIVLDERLAVANAKSLLQTTILIAASSCILLSLAAWLLICKILKPVQESFDKQKQFIWDASHELKTPLAVIRANADVLEMEIGENENLTYIQSEIDRTNLLVSDLLTLARMDHGVLSADIQKVNLSEAVLSVALPLESKAFEDEKQFEIQVDDNVLCQGDDKMLKQLAVILLSNAFKYSDVQGRITLHVCKKGTSAELCVGNSGQGIAKKDQEKIFERFYRADPSRNRSVEGFGFGLSIAKKIIELHKGKIRIFSDPGKWTEFRVYLPTA